MFAGSALLYYVAAPALLAHDLANADEPPSYADLARRFGLKETQIRDHLLAARLKMRDEIRSELARMTRDENELEEEWNALFGS